MTPVAPHVRALRVGYDTALPNEAQYITEEIEDDLADENRVTKTYRLPQETLDQIAELRRLSGTKSDARVIETAVADALRVRQGAPPPDELLNSAEAAALLKTTRWNLNNLIRAGKLPASKVGGRLRFLRSDLDALRKPRGERDGEQQ